MLTTETLIAEKPKKEEKAGGGGHDHGRKCGHCENASSTKREDQ
jgi:hypothetical protein